MKDGVPLGDDDLRFRVETATLPADPATNDFESVESVLTWRVTEAWPGGRMDRAVDSANYSCRSGGNAAGPGVESTTYFLVECEWDWKLKNELIIIAMA